VLLVDGVAEQVVQDGALAGDDGRGGGLAILPAGELVEDAAERVGVAEIGERHAVALDPGDGLGQAGGRGGFAELGVERPAVQGLPQLRRLGSNAARGEQGRGGSGQGVGNGSAGVGGDFLPLHVDVAARELVPADGRIGLLRFVPDERQRQAALDVEGLAFAGSGPQLRLVAPGEAFGSEGLVADLAGDVPADLLGGAFGAFHRPHLPDTNFIGQLPLAALAWPIVRLRHHVTSCVASQESRSRRRTRRSPLGRRMQRGPRRFCLHS
jgi:hypothetical protein